MLAADEIEESIIEEEILSNSQRGNQGPGPASPLHNSRTKAKGKMGLFKMKPPVAHGGPPEYPAEQNRNGPAFVYRQNQDPYQMYPGAQGTTKFDTMNSSMKNKPHHNDHIPPHHIHNHPNYSSIIEEIPQHSTTSNHTRTFGSPSKHH